MMNNEIYKNVTKIHIIEDSETIFSLVEKEGYKYEIPLYQRAFAWEEKEIKQLIEDIFDFEGTNYFIGSLVVAKKDTFYEVIDGQQRLTALYIILHCLNWINKQKNDKTEIQFDLPNTLTFSCRDKSNYTLKNIEDIISLNSTSKEEKKISEEILSGIRIARGILTSNTRIKDFDYEIFLEKLKKVVLFRIEVPKNTDLNHYFEIMNTRGEQLEQTDILKSLLMDYLPETTETNNDREIFATIWDAISDMNGYIQMHFDYKKDGKKCVSNREKIFGPSWDEIPSLEWNRYRNLDSKKLNDGSSFTIDQIIGNENFKVEEEIEVEEERVRFESIIDFPHFLMHTLRVFIHNFDITIPEKNKIGRQLDDKKLLEEFKNVFKYGIIPSYNGDSSKIQEYMSKKFILLMLRLRYFYDKFIIKREFVLNNKDETQNEDGEWSLQKLKYYKNKKGDKNVNFENTFNTKKDTLMIQAAMRVSYTSPKVMHWLTSTLIYLSSKSYNSDMLCTYCEDYVKAAVLSNFLKTYSRDNPPGLDTPHIVFNYLDYLIWKENPSVDFDFEFRTSVEHFYPQHPSEDSFPHWHEVNEKNYKDENKESFNIFGNLCLLQRNINAKFSNLSPTSKIGSYEAAINKGSLKLRLMRDSINDYKKEKQAVDSEVNKEWAKYEGLSYIHEKEMLNKLISACKSKSSNNLYYDEK